MLWVRGNEEDVSFAVLVSQHGSRAPPLAIGESGQHSGLSWAHGRSIVVVNDKAILRFWKHLMPIGCERVVTVSDMVVQVATSTAHPNCRVARPTCHVVIWDVQFRTDGACQMVCSPRLAAS